jgi:proline iminopeptidase
MAKSYDLRAGLQQVDRPVLIIQGHQDPISDKTAEDIHSLIKSSTLKYIAKCGHFPWLEQPEEFRRIMVEFFTASTR